MDYKKYSRKQAMRICAKNICSDCRGGLVAEATVTESGKFNFDVVTIMCTRCGKHDPQIQSKWADKVFTTK